MVTQLAELEKPEQLNRFAYRRSEASNIVSTYINLVNQSPDSDEIWAESEQNLDRLLTTRTQGTRSLSSEQVIRVAKTSEVVSTYSVASRLEKDDSDITRYRVLVGTVLAFTLQRRGLVSEPPLAIDWSKYNSLDALYKESDAIATALREPEVDQQLKRMPDLKSLLETFQNYSTVEPFLKYNQVPYYPGDVANFNSELRDYSFSNKPSAISPLLRKTTFSRWIHRHTDWYNTDEPSIEKAMSKSAEFVYSTQAPKKRRNEACSLRAFLKGSLAREFETDQRDGYFCHRYSLDEMFISTTGSGINSLDDIDFAKTFSSFAEVSYCLDVFKSMVQRFLADGYLTYDNSLGPSTNKRSAGTRAYRQRWVDRGLAFLEDILLLKPGESPSWENLTDTGRERLRRFRPIFQQALPSGKIRSLNT